MKMSNPNVIDVHNEKEKKNKVRNVQGDVQRILT